MMFAKIPRRAPSPSRAGAYVIKSAEGYRTPVAPRTPAAMPPEANRERTARLTAALLAAKRADRTG